MVTSQKEMSRPGSKEETSKMKEGTGVVTVTKSPKTRTKTKRVRREGPIGLDLESKVN